jgi:hypothetical protein
MTIINIQKIMMKDRINLEILTLSPIENTCLPFSVSYHCSHRPTAISIFYKRTQIFTGLRVIGKYIIEKKGKVARKVLFHTP